MPNFNFTEAGFRTADLMKEHQQCFKQSLMEGNGTICVGRNQQIFMLSEHKTLNKRKKVKWSERTHLEARFSEITVRMASIIFWDINILVLLFSHQATCSTIHKSLYNLWQHINITNNKTLYFWMPTMCLALKKGHYAYNSCYSF